MREHLNHVMSWTSPIEPTRPNLYGYASSASAVLTDLKGVRGAHGDCLRKQWFRIRGVKENRVSVPNNYQTGWLGDAVHEAVYDRFRQAGTYVDSEIPMWDAAHNVSGRADLIFRDPESGTLIGADIKTKWGYHGSIGTIESRKTTPLFPSYGDILQAAVYLDWFKQFGIHQWGIFYVHRGNGTYGEHYIQIPDYSGWDQMGITAEMKARQGMIVVSNREGEHVMDIGMVEIYDRWDTLWAHLNGGTLPEPDYQLQYTQDQLQEMADKGELSKTDAATFKRNSFVAKGQWECRYCRHNGTCFEDNQWKTPRTNQEVLNLIS